MDSITLLELRLTEQLLNSTLFDGRAVKELLSKDEAGAVFIRRVVAMLTSQEVDIVGFGGIIPRTGREHRPHLEYPKRHRSAVGQRILGWMPKVTGSTNA